MTSNRYSNEAQDTPLENFRDLLGLAEDIQGRCDDLARRASTYSLMALSLVAVFLLVLLVTLFVNNVPLDSGIPLLEIRDSLDLLVVVGIHAYIGFGVVLAYVLTSRIRRRLNREHRSLYEVLDLLREVESSYSSKYDLSPLERAELRIRMSRFSIAPEASFFGLIPG